MKFLSDNEWDDGSMVAGHSVKSKRKKLCNHELDELREHIDLISFNILKVYHHAKDRSKKEFNKSKTTFKKKVRYSQKDEKKIFQ